MDEDYVANGIAKPDWIKDPETGALLPIEKDAEYRTVLAEFYASECLHTDTEPMKVMIADGRVQVVKCCTHCGERVGSPMSQKDREWVAGLRSFPPELTGSYEVHRHEKKKAMLLALARKQYADRGRFTQSYQDYMASLAWNAKRDKVLNRCNGICEGCGEKSAREVHHLSYRHFMEEFLFELIGLCHDCHDRLHREEVGDEEEGEELQYG